MNRFCQNICWHLSNTFRGVFCKEQIIEHTSMVCLLHFEEDKSLAQFPHLFRNTYFLYKTQNLQVQNGNYNYNNTIQRGITLNIIKSSHPFLCWIWNLVRKRHCTNLTTIELQLTILTMIFKVLSTITNSNGFRVLLWIYNLNIIWNECCTCKEIDRHTKQIYTVKHWPLLSEWTIRESLCPIVFTPIHIILWASLCCSLT